MVETRCTRCGGEIDEEGFCARCGHRAALAAVGGATTEAAGAAGDGAPAASTPLDSAIVPNPLAGITSGRLTSRRRGNSPTTQTSRTSRATGRGRGRSAFGIALPPVLPAEPEHVILKGEIPERKRYCRACGAKPNRLKGFCPRCGAAYSFIPPLGPGSLVVGRYEVRGAIGYGGLGWIYLARDGELGRWVVLKGVLDANDPSQAEVAAAERRFLAAVKHPSIVSIYDVITEGSVAYIVMEFVNGKTLLTLRKEHGGPLPPREAISGILEILPAFAYMHQQGLVYNDFKPENVMVEDGHVKLIDLGAVRRIDDQTGDVYATQGYCAPEAGDSPSPQADLYSIGRALAVLLIDFDFQGIDQHQLPTPTRAPILAAHESLYLWLLKATRHDPAHRFQTAEEMAAQLLLVLRDIVMADDPLPPAVSTIFAAGGDGGPWAADESLAQTLRLPTLLPSADDPAHALLLPILALPEPRARAEQASHLAAVTRGTRAAWWAATEAALAAKDVDLAARTVAAATTALGDEAGWPLTWLEGRIALARGDGPAAQAALAPVVAELPGEPAPKLALAGAHELAGEHQRAASAYALVRRAHPTMTTAYFGLGRCLVALGKPAEATTVLESLPPTSAHHQAAQLAVAAEILATPAAGLTADDLVRAATAIERLGNRGEHLDALLLRARLFQVAATKAATDGPALAGLLPGAGTPTARGFRLAAAAALRRSARLAETPEERAALVDAANAVRPFSLW